MAKKSAPPPPEWQKQLIGFLKRKHRVQLTPGDIKKIETIIKKNYPFFIGVELFNSYTQKPSK